MTRRDSRGRKQKKKVLDDDPETKCCNEVIEKKKMPSRTNRFPVRALEPKKSKGAGVIVYIAKIVEKTRGFGTIVRLETGNGLYSKDNVPVIKNHLLVENEKEAKKAAAGPAPQSQENMDRTEC